MDLTLQKLDTGVERSPECGLSKDATIKVLLKHVPSDIQEDMLVSLMEENTQEIFNRVPEVQLDSLKGLAIITFNCLAGKGITKL